MDISKVKKIKEDKAEIEDNMEDIELPLLEDMKPNVNEESLPVKRRGRPKKEVTIEQTTDTIVKKKRGRPKKNQEEDIKKEADTTIEESRLKKEEDIVNLFDMDDEEENNTLPGFESLDKEELENEDDIILPGFDNLDEIEDLQLPGLENQETNIPMPKMERNTENKNVSDLEKIENADNNIDLSNLLTKDKKIVAFIGTSKNGTSFIVNNLAQLLSEQGIKTAILDLTKNKNAYYVYTNNQEELRQTAFASIPNLVNGIAKGIEINRNLSVFTTLPNEDEITNNYSAILETLLKNYSLILLDCDFNTNYGYFKEAQEIYLVQSLDVLTIQPLTAFLRDLKAKNILNPEKLRIVLNKTLRVRNITDKLIIGGISVYNDPAMSFMTELFNKDLIKYCSIPFEEQTYSRYLEGLVDCKITLKGYSKKFLMYLSKLGNMVYPLINNSMSKKTTNSYNTYNKDVKFTNQMNETLNKMKNNY